MIGYWKNSKQSYSQWFNQLTDYQRFKAVDSQMQIAFHQHYLFIGRELVTESFDSHHNLVQIFKGEE